MVVRAVSRNKQKRPSKQSLKPPLPSPVSSIAKIGSLNRYPDKDVARDLLHEAAVLVAPIIHAHKFKVGTLCEMFPKNPNLLGLNVNHGQKILIRLRFHSNDRQFYPMCDIIGTFLHELSHNVHGPHDEKFYSLLDKLKAEYDQSRSKSASSTDYRCEQQKLGRAGLTNGYVPIRAQRIKALSNAPKFISESRVLGSGSSSSSTTPQGKRSTTRDNRPTNPRQLALEAAEQRLKDSEWCSKGEELELVEPAAGEVEIVDLTDDGESTSKKAKLSEYASIVDLTCDEIGELLHEDEIITIDACEAGPKSILKNPGEKRGNGGRKVNFKDEDVNADTIIAPETGVDGSPRSIQHEEKAVTYTASKSSRAFFGDEQHYPRRKMVASLNFTQIIESNVTALEISSQDDPSKLIRKTRTKKKPKRTIARKPANKPTPKSKGKSKVNAKKSTDPKTFKATTKIRPPQKTVKEILFSDLF